MSKKKEYVAKKYLAHEGKVIQVGEKVEGLEREHAKRLVKRGLIEEAKGSEAKEDATGVTGKEVNND